jgi:hypothetical protein
MSLCGRSGYHNDDWSINVNVYILENLPCSAASNTVCMRHVVILEYTPG